MYNDAAEVPGNCIQPIVVSEHDEGDEVLVTNRIQSRIEQGMIRRMRGMECDWILVERRSPYLEKEQRYWEAS